MRLPVRPVREPEGLDPAMRARLQSQRVGVVGAEQQQPPARDEVHEPLKRQADGVQVRIDIGVVELDVADHGNVRQVLQELRGLVEERAVVVVPLDDELSPAANSVAAVEVFGDTADEHAGIGAAVSQEPSGQRRRRGLAVSTRYDDRPRSPQKMIADGFRQRAVANLPGRAPLRAPGCRARWRFRPRRGPARR